MEVLFPLTKQEVQLCFLGLQIANEGNYFRGFDELLPLIERLRNQYARMSDIDKER